MRIRRALTCVTVLSLAALLGACGTTKPAATAESAAPSGAPQSAAAPTPQAVKPQAAPSGSKLHPLDDPSSALSKRSVYYEFDKSDVAPEYRALVEAHARYLRD